MALNWSSARNFLGLLKGGRAGARADAYPSKKTMNLYQGSAGQEDYRTTAVVGVALLVAIVLFVNFAVLGPLGRVQQKERELAEARAQLAPIAAQVEDYAQVFDEYTAYTPVSSASGIDATSVLALVEGKVMPYATVSQLSLKETTLTLGLSNVTLQTVGNIASALHGEPGVVNVSVSTAATSVQAQDAGVVATLTVELLGNPSSTAREE